jgi:hypothetical protein
LFSHSHCHVVFHYVDKPQFSHSALTDVWVVYSLGLLQIMLLWTFRHTPFDEYLHIFLLFFVVIFFAVIEMVLKFFSVDVSHTFYKYSFNFVLFLEIELVGQMFCTITFWVGTAEMLPENVLTVKLGLHPKQPIVTASLCYCCYLWCRHCCYVFKSARQC